MSAIHSHPFDPSSVVDFSVSRLKDLLWRQFAAGNADLAGQARAAAGRLPDELAQSLTGLAEAEARLKAADSADPEELAEFAFRCGQLYEQIETFRRIEMELENVRQGPASIDPAPLQSPQQVESLARFIELRDQVFRKVADFTLKAILIGLGLLALGLALGLV